MRGLLASPLGFLIGFSLGALGGGGSILAVPALVYVAGQSAKAATTTSLVIVGATALWGMISHLRAGRVRLGSGVAFGLTGMGGSFAGSLLNRAVPAPVLLLAFSGLMVVAAWRMWTNHRAEPQVPADLQGGGVSKARHNPGTESTPRVSNWLRGTLARIVLIGTGVGLLTGFFGVGGGFIIVPGLVLALGYDMPIAVGTSLLVIAINSAEALAFRLTSGGIDWSVAGPFTIAGLVGVTLGANVAGRVPADRLTRWFVWLLLAVAAYTGARSLATL